MELKYLFYKICLDIDNSTYLFNVNRNPCHPYFALICKMVIQIFQLTLLLKYTKKNLCHLLFQSVSQSAFSSKSSRHHKSQTVRARELTF